MISEQSPFNVCPICGWTRFDHGCTCQFCGSHEAVPIARNKYVASNAEEVVHRSFTPATRAEALSGNPGRIPAKIQTCVTVFVGLITRGPLLAIGGTIGFWVLHDGVGAEILNGWGFVFMLAVAALSFVTAVALSESLYARSVALVMKRCHNRNAADWERRLVRLFDVR